METNRSKDYDPVVQSQSADAPALGSQGLRLGALPKVKNIFCGVIVEVVMLLVMGELF